MLPNYEQLIEKISRASGLSIEEINRKIEAKRAKLSGLISREGAAQIVSAELGINFEKEKVKINEIVSGMKKVNVVGKIIKLFPIREYEKNDKKGKVENFILADSTGNIRTVLWDTNHIALIEKAKIKEEDTVEISSAYVRNGELHLTGFSDIKLSNEKIENAITEISYQEAKLNEIKAGQRLKARAFIVQVFEPRFFEACPECNKKVTEGNCDSHGKVISNKRAIINLVLDDGAENVRAVLFNEQIEKLGIKTDEISGENFIINRAKLLGEERFFSGAVKQNELFNNLEIFVNDIEEINNEKIIEKLETQKI